MTLVDVIPVLESREASIDGFEVKGAEDEQRQHDDIPPTQSPVQPKHIISLFARIAGNDTTGLPTPPVTARPGGA